MLRIVGPPNTPVVLTLVRPGSGDTFRVFLTRGAANSSLLGRSVQHRARGWWSSIVVVWHVASDHARGGDRGGVCEVVVVVVGVELHCSRGVWPS